MLNEVCNMVWHWSAGNSAEILCHPPTWTKRWQRHTTTNSGGAQHTDCTIGHNVDNTICITLCALHERGRSIEIFYYRKNWITDAVVRNGGQS